MKPLARPFNRTATRLTGTGAIALAVALGAVVTSSAPAMASAGTVSVTYQVKVTAAGFSGTGSGSVSLTTTAPATVAPGGAVKITATSGSIALPSSFDGVTLVDVKNISVTVKVPANSKYVSCALTGGSGLGSGKPTCSQKSGIVTFKVPGPIPGGTTVTPPVVTLNLKAGTSGSIQSKLGGTSFSKPGLKGTADLSAFGVPFTAKAVGFPKPSPVLTTTKIS